MNRKNYLSYSYKGMAIGLLSISVSLSSPGLNARTLWESEDTLSNINAIGFAHIDIAEVDNDDRGQLAVDEGFQEARVAGHISSRFARRFTTFIETEITATEDDINFEVERAVVKYDVDNSSQVSIGRYHAPAGYWNQFYHHGRWLQTTKDRPVQSEFGNGFLPSHFWGAMYEKRITSENYVVDLDVGVGSGRDETFVIPDFAGPVNASGDESLTAQISVSPTGNRNLSLGGSFWIGDLKSNTGLEIGEQVFTAHLNYRTISGEFLGEVSLVQHDYSNGLEDTESYGGYLEYSHRLTGFNGKLKPYGRVDYLKIDSQDLLYTSLQTTNRQTLGVRYDVSDSASIKVEVRRDDFEEDDAVLKSLQLQLATFF